MSRKSFVENYKYKIFALSFATVIFSTIIANLLFKTQASLVIIFLITLTLAPLIFYTIKIEEDFDYKGNTEKLDLKHHYGVIKLYLLIFAGSLLSFLFLYLTLPPGFLYNVFNLQVSNIGSKLAYDSFASAFYSIFLNNFKVLFICVFLSLIYGTGSLLILMWNSSFLSIVLGEAIKNSPNFLNTSISLLTYLSYGILEISAYFLGGLAGGIIAIAIIKHHYKSKKFYFVLRDATFLFLISILILLLGAGIESLVVI